VAGERKKRRGQACRCRAAESRGGERDVGAGEHRKRVIVTGDQEAQGIEWRWQLAKNRDDRQTRGDGGGEAAT
jgi:hypothetical protein